MLLEYTKKYFRLRRDKMNPAKRKKLHRAALLKAAEEVKEPTKVEESVEVAPAVEKIVEPVPEIPEVTEEASVPAVPSKKKKGA
jgi:hypothetical protein